MRNSVENLLLCVLVTSVCSAQTIPNGGFETWSAGAPTGWFTSNLLTIYVPVTESTSAHGGSFAAQGTVVRSIAGTGYPPSLAAGIDGTGFPINARPAALHGWYKFSSDTGDAFSASVSVKKNGSPIGVGILSSPTPRGVYTEFVINISYLTADIPDTALIFVIVTNTPSVHIGSSFTLDDLSFGPATSVEESGTRNPYSFALEQNYPNPFNPATMIQFQIEEAGVVTLKVYNLLGQEVATLVDEPLSSGRYRVEFDGAHLPTGTYFYRLQSGGNSEVRRMTIVR